jgi:hypothetical protein
MVILRSHDVNYLLLHTKGRAAIKKQSPARMQGKLYSIITPACRQAGYQIITLYLVLHHNQICDQPRPAGLVRSAQPAAIVAMKIFVE